MTRISPRDRAAAPCRPGTPGRWRRRGSMYIAVLGAAMLITVLGLSGVLAARIDGRSAVAETDIAEARRCAAAALELGRYSISSTSTWRSRGVGTWLSNVPLGKGLLSLSVTDPVDADLSSGQAKLTGTGTCGSATQMYSVTLSPQTTGWSCLDIGVFAAGAVTMTSSTVVADRSLGSNTSVSAVTSSVQTNVESAGTIAGGTYTMATTSGAAARTAPDSTVFTWYTSNGAGLSIGSVPSVSGRKTIQKCVLSANSNSFGGGNSANGVYVLDCQNNPITIQDCRIMATLVILNPGVGSMVTGSVRWDAPSTGQPALLVRGDFTLALSQTSLSEATTATNFNPSGTPYNGVADSDTLDTYPSSINGLVYISGNAAFLGANTIRGAVAIGGTLAMSVNTTTGVASRLDFAYDGTFYGTPPNGFAAPTRMVVNTGSYVQVVN